MQQADSQPGGVASGQGLTFPVKLRCGQVADLCAEPGLEDALARALGRAFATAQAALPAALALGQGVMLNPPRLVNASQIDARDADQVLQRVRRAIEAAAHARSLPLSLPKPAERPSGAKPERAESPGTIPVASERFDPGRFDARGATYVIPSYDGGKTKAEVARPASPASESASAQQAALRRITQLLSTGILDWAVTDAEAREVLHILLGLAPEDLMRVVQAMRVSGRWATLGRQIPADADDDVIELQKRMDPNSGYLMPGDTVRVELGLVQKRQEDVSRDYVLSSGRLSLPGLDQALQVTGLLPAELPDRIARAYVDGLIYVEPWVKVAVVARGSLYAPRHGPTRGLLWYTSRPIERSPQIQAQLDKRRELLAYISEVRPDDDRTRNALDRYHTWIEKHYRTPEFLRQTGPALWSASLREASAPAPVSARGRFLELASAVQRTVSVASGAERLRIINALGDYLSWLDKQTDDALAGYDPVKVWARFKARRDVADVKAEVAEKVRREREAAAEAAAKVDWEGAGRKLDEALELMKKSMWREREPYTLEDRERGTGYLVWESAQEKAARDLIAREFLHDVVARMGRKDFTSTSIASDFRTWLREHPSEYEAYLVAQSHPDVEKYDVPIEIPAWQTTIEVAIGFIPVVGSIVAAGEATFGYDLFGHELSTVDRAILGASVLLPAAAKVFKVGRAAVTVSTLTREYRLSAREADAAYRALTHVQPGTKGASLLASAAADVKAGRPVRDAKRLNELGALFRDMGMTERATANELRAGAEEAALEGHAGRPGQEVADLFATGEEASELTEAAERDASRPAVTGGKRPRIGDVAVPTKKRVRLDIENLARAPGESARGALARAKTVLGHKVEDTLLKDIWRRARAKVVGGRSLDNATRQEMFDLYGRVRDEFWTQARADPDAVRFLESAGFEFPAQGKAPLLKVIDPPPGLGLPKASEIPIQERRLSLDHNLEKAIGENYRKAIDADNLTFELHNPNSNRETVQVKFGLRPTPGVSEDRPLTAPPASGSAAPPHGPPSGGGPPSPAPGAPATPPPPPPTPPHIIPVSPNMNISGDTAGTGGVTGISGLRARDGSQSISIDGRVLPSLGTSRQGFETNLVRGSDLGLSNYDLLHLWGPRLGDEAAAGIWLGPKTINTGVQARVENQLKGLAQGANSRGGRLTLRVTGATHPPADLPANLRAHDFLAEVKYQFRVEIPGTPPASGEVTIRIGPPPDGRVELLGAASLDRLTKVP
jgi:hypothetical protein